MQVLDIKEDFTYGGLYLLMLTLACMI